MKTKILYMVIETKDGESRLLSSFNNEWFDELRSLASSANRPISWPGVDDAGFGWYELKVPVKSTLKSLGLGLDAADLFPLNIN